LAEYSEEFTLEDEGTYVLCVEALDSYVKVLTFEFYFSHPEIDEALKCKVLPFKASRLLRD
jgi:hypothetical protein